MTVERDMAGTGLSFAVGIAVATVIAAHGFHLCTYGASACLIIISAATCTLMHPIHNQLNDKALRIITLATILCCGIFTSLSFSVLDTGQASISGLLADSASAFCEKLKTRIAGIPFSDKESNAIATALLTGDRSLLNRDCINAFRTSGASHILALSGLHLGIIYGFLKALSSPCGKSAAAKGARSVIITSACGFYTMATGASASITRAFLFILLGEAAELSGRSKSLKSIFWSALFIQLAANPLSITDTGFQLSYSAIFGIAYIYPHLKRFWPEGIGLIYNGLRWIWNSVSVSLACQMTTGLLAWSYFGSFPVYFLLTNLIALPLAGIIIPACLAVVILDTSGICPDILVRITEWLIQALTGSLETIASL